jgi:DHA1 family multidrug resistance protein-like MFS transporter
MVTTGIGLCIGALLVMVVADNVISWSASRALYGFGSGLILPGLRRAATVLDPRRVGENLGRLIVGEVGGFLIGPMAAGILAEIGGLRLPFAVFAVAMVLFLPFCLRLPADQGRRDTSGRRLAFDLLRGRRLQGALVLVTGYFVLIGAFEAVIPVMYRDRGASTLITGFVFSTFAVPILFVSPLAGRLSDRVEAARVATLGILAVSIGAAFYGVLPGYVWPALLMGVGGFADGFGFTATQVTVSRAVSEERQAGALGLMGATEVLAAGISATPSAVAYEYLGAELAWPVIASTTIAIVAVAQVLLRGTTPVNRSSPEPARM